MINLQNVTASIDGQFKRISLSWDEVDETGKTVGPNKRMSRIVTDDKIVACVDELMEYSKNIIEEEVE